MQCEALLVFGLDLQVVTERTNSDADHHPMLQDPYNERQYAKAQTLLMKGHLLRLFDHSGNPTAFLTCGDSSVPPIKLPPEVAYKLIEDKAVQHATKGWNYDDYISASTGSSTQAS